MSIAGLTGELTDLGDDGAGARRVEARGGAPPKDDAAAQFAVRMRNGSALYLAPDPRFGSLSLQRKHVEAWIWKLTHALDYAHNEARAKRALEQARKDRAEQERAAKNAQMASELGLTVDDLAHGGKRR